MSEMGELKFVTMQLMQGILANPNCNFLNPKKVIADAKAHALALEKEFPEPVEEAKPEEKAVEEIHELKPEVKVAEVTEVPKGAGGPPMPEHYKCSLRQINRTQRQN